MIDVTLIPLDSMLTLARPNGPHIPAVAAVAIGAWALCGIAGKTAKSSRRHNAATELKRCAGCRGEHPGFAAFCRHCGRKF